MFLLVGTEFIFGFLEGLIQFVHDSGGINGSGFLLVDDSVKEGYRQGYCEGRKGGQDQPSGRVKPLDEFPCRLRA